MAAVGCCCHGCRRLWGLTNMDLTLSLQRAVRGFALGSEALAARLRLSVTSLNHKVSPTYAGAHASPEEAAEICEVTGDHGFLHALSARLGYVALPVGVGQEHGSMQALAETVREFGELASAAASGMADGRVTGNEMACIDAEAAEAIAAITRLVECARALHRASMPAVGGTD